MNMTTAHRPTAFLMWLAGVGLMITAVVQETGATAVGAVMMFTALILLRICDLEDRLKRMSDD